MAIFIQQTHTFEDGTTASLTLAGEFENVAAAQAHLTSLAGMLGESSGTFTFVSERTAPTLTRA